MAKPNVVSKEDLVEAAKQCIAERGADKTTLNAVAQKAGVTQGTVFYHFRTKERLLFEVVEDMCKKSWQSLEAYMGNEHASVHGALEGSKSRCTYDSPYHKLFYSLFAAGLHQPNIREQTGGTTAG
ncbi:TetR/AcrR family transcriptional regulator [Paenibacillus sp. P26]|nr:TetR/AcrR family transcriptional regulator [Paenibacillus sp. P26]